MLSSGRHGSVFTISALAFQGTHDDIQIYDGHANTDRPADEKTRLLGQPLGPGHVSAGDGAATFDGVGESGQTNAPAAAQRDEDRRAEVVVGRRNGLHHHSDHLLPRLRMVLDHEYARWLSRNLCVNSADFTSCCGCLVVRAYQSLTVHYPSLSIICTFTPCLIYGSFSLVVHTY